VHFATEPEVSVADFNKVGVLILRGDRLLLCRKNRDTSKLILPGGRVEAGESDVDCLTRELREELGEVVLRNVEYVGTYEDRAAFDDPAVVKTLRIALYRGDMVGAPTPASEITEIIWFGPDSDVAELTPIFLNRILPDLLSRGILSWSAKRAPEPRRGER
jgi:8-oxo-dGTP pyrophosphatase MutT (NUDIX family)